MAAPMTVPASSATYVAPRGTPSNRAIRLFILVRSVARRRGSGVAHVVTGSSANARANIIPIGAASATVASRTCTFMSRAYVPAFW
jgi:hypothetical protein